MSSRDEALQTIRQLSSSLSLRELARVVLKLIRDHAGVDRGTLFVVDRAKDEIRSIAADRVVGQISLPIGFGIAGSVAETGQIIDTNNPRYDDRYDEKYEAILAYDTKDIYCMPILNRDKVVVGVLQLLNRQRPFTSEDHEFLSNVAAEIAAILTHR